MTSCCDDAPCDNRGYNVCIENTTTLDILFNFFYATPGILSGTEDVLQSVTVEAGNTICYRINVSPGAILGVNALLAEDTTTIVSTTYIACSVHLRAFTGPSFDSDNTPFAVISDCTPCPISCGFACDDEKSCQKKEPCPPKPDCKPVKKVLHGKKRTYPCKPVSPCS